MKKLFCQSCGKKHEFNYSPPNFCSGCGEKLGSHAETKPESNEEDEDEDVTDVSQVPEIDKLEMDDNELNIGAKRTITLGDMLLNPTPPDYSPKKRQDLSDFLDGKE